MTQWNDRPGQDEGPRPSWTAPGGPDGPPPPGAPTGSPMSPPGVPGPGGVTPGPGLPPTGAPAGGFPPVGTRQLWPGPIPLRPLEFGEIIETAFRLLRHNPRTLLGLSFVVLMTVSLVAVLLAAVVTAAAGGFTDGDPAASIPGSIALQLASLPVAFIGFFLSGFLVVPVAEAALGHRLTAGAAWARVKGRMVSLLGYLVLYVLLVLVGLVPAGLALWWAGEQSSAIGMGVTFAVVFPLLVALYVWIGVKFSLAPAAIVLERQGPVAGIRRSFALTRHAFWRTWAIQVVVGLITWLISSVVSSILVGIGMAAILIPVAASGGSQTEPSGVALFIVMAVVTVGAALTNTLVQPLSAAATSLVYLDRRFRTEALAVELMAVADRERGPRLR